MKKILFISIYCFNSFGIRSLHSFSKNCGVDSHALFFKDSLANCHPEITDKEISLFRQQVKQIDPDLIGIGLLEPYSLVAKRLVKEIRSISNANIICGGTFATVNPERALEFADYACVGEGEKVVADVIESYSQMWCMGT